MTASPESSLAGGDDPWQPMTTAPTRRGERILGWCIYPAGAEARFVERSRPWGHPGFETVWMCDGVQQDVVAWQPEPKAPKLDGSGRNLADTNSNGGQP